VSPAVNLHLVDPTEMILHLGIVRPKHRSQWHRPKRFDPDAIVIHRYVVTDDDGVEHTRYGLDLLDENDDHLRHEILDTYREAFEVAYRHAFKWGRTLPILRVRDGVWILWGPAKLGKFYPWKDIHPDVTDPSSPEYIEGLKRDG
jgi:hypothetical protein